MKVFYSCPCCDLVFQYLNHFLRHVKTRPSRSPDEAPYTTAMILASVISEEEFNRNVQVEVSDDECESQSVSVSSVLEGQGTKNLRSDGNANSSLVQVAKESDQLGHGNKDDVQIIVDDSVATLSPSSATAISADISSELDLGRQCKRSSLKPKLKRGHLGRSSKRAGMVLSNELRSLKINNTKRKSKSCKWNQVITATALTGGRILRPVRHRKPDSGGGGSEQTQIQMAKRKNRKWYKCPRCPQTTSRHTTLLAHITTHRGRGRTRQSQHLRLQEVARPKSRPSQVNRLVKSVPRKFTEDLPIPCTICKCTFKDELGLILHQKFHKFQRNSKYVCKCCSKEYIYEAAWIQHRRYCKDVK